MQLPNACNDKEPLLDPATLQEKLKVGTASYNALLRKGLPRYQMNKRVFRFRWSEIEAWLMEYHRGDAQ